MRIASVAFGLMLGACLLAAWWALSQGLGGKFIFDDSWNLRGLERISERPDWETALHYILSGFSSALGRPLALATFAPQFHSWPMHAEDFIRVNILIHLLNGALLCWCALLLQRLAGRDGIGAGLVALALCAAWLWAPLQASGVLYVIQRMALLSATFMFAGLALYLAGRARLPAQPRAALALMTAGLGVGVGLGILAKENSILLPLGILVLEVTLLRAFPAGPVWRRWSWPFLWAPTLFVAAYLAWQLPGLFDEVPSRGFTPGERLLTESRVLFVYLYKLVLPSLYSIRLLYDDLEVSRSLLSPWTTLPSLLGWLALTVAALRLRARAPVFSFAVLWYLAHHLLESTLIPLELAFEHRNYVASVGPLAAGVWGLGALWTSAHARRVRPVVLLGAAGYLAFQLTALSQSASLWGRPLELAQHWATYQPESRRATMMLADTYLSRGQIAAAAATLEQAMERWPGDPALPLALLEMGCYFRTAVVPPMSRLEDSLERFDAQDLGTINLLDRLVGNMEDGYCDRYTPALMYQIVSRVMAAPAFERHHRNLHLIRSRIAELAGDRRQALEDLDASIRIQPLMSLLEHGMYWSIESGDADRARRYLALAQAQRTLNPVKAVEERRALKRMEWVMEQYARDTLESPIADPPPPGAPAQTETQGP